VKSVCRLFPFYGALPPPILFHEILAALAFAFFFSAPKINGVFSFNQMIAFGVFFLVPIFGINKGNLGCSVIFFWSPLRPLWEWAELLLSFRFFFLDCQMSFTRSSLPRGPMMFPTHNPPGGFSVLPRFFFFLMATSIRT